MTTLTEEMLMHSFIKLPFAHTISPTFFTQCQFGILWIANPIFLHLLGAHLISSSYYSVSVALHEIL